MTQLTPEQLQIFLDVATESVLAAGAVLQDRWGKFNNVQEKGRQGDLVTEADILAVAEVLKVLNRHLPDHQILAEESGALGNANSQYLWAIDPLDGTTNYAHGLPLVATSVGLMIDGVPSVGAVYNPFSDELFRAAKGLGATCNRIPIRVSQTEELSKSLLITGFAYDRRETTDNNYAEFCHMTHLTQGVRRLGCASMDLAGVACGRLDGYWERGIQPWDMAAGIVIVEEAGGKVTAYDGSPLDIASGRILATNSLIHDSLSKALLETPDLTSWKK
ncbi:MAG: inositol monophosphatase family protein [Pleurocapsa sp.]